MNRNYTNEIDAPSGLGIDHIERLANADGSFCITDAAKALKVSTKGPVCSAAGREMNLQLR